MTRPLLILLLAGMAAGAQQPRLQPRAIAVGSPLADVVVTDLDGDGNADLAVQTTAGQLRLWIQAGDSAQFRAAGGSTIPEGTAALAVSDLVPDGGREVAFLSSTGVRVLVRRRGAWKLEPFADLPLMFTPGYRGAPRFWGWGEDVDGDGREDLLVPGPDHDWLLRGRGTGGKASPPIPVTTLQVERRARWPAGSAGVVRRRPRVGFRSLLPGAERLPVFMDAAGVHALRARGAAGFGPQSQLVFPLRGEHGDPLDVLQRLDVTFARLDADALEDLVVTRTRVDTSAHTFEQRTQLLFFLGAERPARQPRQVLVLPGVLSGGPYLRDLDGDGRVDLFLSLYAGRLSANLARLVMRNVKLDYLLYLGREGPQPFSRAPDRTLEDRVSLEDFAEWNRRHRLLLVHDWTGDGRSDLIRVEAAEDSLRVRLEQPFAEGEPPSLDLRLPGSFSGWSTYELRPGRPMLLLRGTERLVIVTRELR